MKFIRDLMSRKSKDAQVEDAPNEPVINIQDSRPVGSALPPITSRTVKVAVTNENVSEAVVSMDQNAILKKLNSRLAEDSQQPAANIWDLQETADVDDTTTAAKPRRRRNATRVLGFDPTANDVVNPFDTTPKAKPAERTKFPVGWMLISEGPGRGECFTLEAGMSQIGRGEDQAIQLDFGDNSISRSNHAAIVYDTETHIFKLGHGGKKNVVRLNDEPVISNETLTAGDKIKIGETTLHFVPLCSADFNWTDADDTKENDHVAIA
jgi:hypothetical protein